MNYLNSKYEELGTKGGSLGAMEQNVNETEAKRSSRPAGESKIVCGSVYVVDRLLRFCV